MSVIEKLASSLGRRDEMPNQELAKHIVAENDDNAIRELVEHLNNKSRNIQSDCIKVLYEIGDINPALIAGYAKNFIALLDDHKNNRLQWGAMTAINAITLQNPKLVYEAISKIVAAADKGSVITKDNGVGILIQLCSIKAYAGDAFVLLNAQLLGSPVNQLPMYAEKAMPIINESNKAVFIKTLTARLGDIDKETKRKRVEKVIAKFRSK